ncbi:shikimate kinase [Chlamydiales bacterium]|nr:shikimate kinase [Chlamydiales bacterium]
MSETIVLIGMPQSGKSTVGKMVAEQLNYSFHDVDRLIEKHYSSAGKGDLNSKEIYKKEGEDYYRNLEKEIFSKIVYSEKAIIATGGGTPIHVPGFDKLTDHTKVVFLYCTLNTLWKRIEEMNEVPAILNSINPFTTFKEIYKARLVYYLTNSHHKIDATNQSENEIANAIITNVQ